MKNHYQFISSYAPAVVSPSHQARWETLIKNHEVIGLQKEVLHLERKSQERELSDWERERLEEVRSHLAELAH